MREGPGSSCGQLWSCRAAIEFQTEVSRYGTPNSVLYSVVLLLRSVVRSSAASAIQESSRQTHLMPHCSYKTVRCSCSSGSPCAQCSLRPRVHGAAGRLVRSPCARCCRSPLALPVCLCARRQQCAELPPQWHWRHQWLVISKISTVLENECSTVHAPTLLCRHPGLVSCLKHVQHYHCGAVLHYQREICCM